MESRVKSLPLINACDHVKKVELFYANRTLYRFSCMHKGHILHNSYRLVRKSKKIASLIVLIKHVAYRSCELD